ncbi:MAG: hypothetical protein R3D66_07025 [Alphaproteobacteria bacterium]
MLKKTYYKMGAAMTAGMLALSGGAAHAGTNTFSTIAHNMQISASAIPGLLTALAYLFGLLLAVLGVMKIKDHVENPTQTPLKDGAIRLAAGGALFALPIMLEAMFETINGGTVGNSASTQAASLRTADFEIH